MPKPAKTSRPALSNRTNAFEHRFGPIEYRPVDSLTNYNNNPRKHPERQLVKLAGSIAEFGFVMPVLIDEDGVIIAGEARVAEVDAGHVDVIVVYKVGRSSIDPVRARSARPACRRSCHQASGR